MNNRGISLAAVIVAGMTYDPGHFDLDDDQPVSVWMTLRDYRRARQDVHYRSPQLIALKSAERFVKAELETRQRAYLPNPTEQEQHDLNDAMETMAIICNAIVKGEVEFANSKPKQETT